MSPDMRFFLGLILAINGLLYYFAYVVHPSTYASGRPRYWRTRMRATFWAGLFCSAPMLLLLSGVMNLQGQGPDHLRSLGLEPYSGIEHVVGLPFTPGVSRVGNAMNGNGASGDDSEYAYVFELRGKAEEALAFYRHKEHHGDWTLVKDDIMLIFERNGMLLSIHASDEWDGSTTMSVMIYPDE